MGHHQFPACKVGTIQAETELTGGGGGRNQRLLFTLFLSIKPAVEPDRLGGLKSKRFHLPHGECSSLPEYEIDCFSVFS
jgi:hypothetical protein